MEARHADAFFAPMQEDALYQWIAMNKPPSLEWLRARWLRNESRMAPDGKTAWLAWAVRRKMDGAYLGCVDADIDDHMQAVNFGYFFFPAHWGKGYASAAVIATTRHLAAMGVHRFVATVTAGNKASTCVLQHAGFTFNRLLPANDVIRGVAVDDEEYVKTV